MWGLRLVLAAFVCGLVVDVVTFPVWSFDGGLGMRILLAFIPVEPIAFLLARVGYAGTIVLVAGVYLLERRRVEATVYELRWWSRERIALALAFGAAACSLGTFILLAEASYSLPADLDPFAAKFAVQTALNFVALIALGLYFLWTAERFAGSVAKIFGLAAITLAIASRSLNIFLFWSFLGAAVSDFDFETQRLLSTASWLCDTGSTALWILVYTRIVRGPSIRTPAVPVATDP